MDMASLLGLLIGFGGILLGNVLEGGQADSLMQGTAALIVLTGTLGAVLISNRGQDIRRGFQLAWAAFHETESKLDENIRDVLDCARTVRKENLLALEPKLGKISDPFLRQIVRNLIDGTENTLTKEIFESRLESEEEDLLAAAKIWSDAGGFAPTIGIIGAVLGLIHVMGNLTDTSKLGAGIAVAFVATIYGVSFANLLFLPLGNKIKKNIARQIKEKKVVLEGGLLINSSLSPVLIDQKMRAFATVIKETK